MARNVLVLFVLAILATALIVGTDASVLHEGHVGALRDAHEDAAGEAEEPTAGAAKTLSVTVRRKVHPTSSGGEPAGLRVQPGNSIHRAVGALS